MKVFITLVDHLVLGVFPDEVSAKIALADYAVDPFGEDFEEASIVEQEVQESIVPVPAPAPESFDGTIIDNEDDRWIHEGHGLYTLDGSTSDSDYRNWTPSRIASEFGIYRSF